MNIWDRTANMQSLLKGDANNPGPINISGGYLPFTVAHDTAGNLPKNPGAYTDLNKDSGVLEERRKALETLAKTNPEIAAGTIGFMFAGPVGAGVGAGLAFGIRQADNATNGAVGKLITTGVRELRSNYAYQRDVTDKNAAMGFLTGLLTVAGGVVGGVAGGVLGPGGVAAGAVLGAQLASAAGRRTAEAGAVGKSLQQSAKLSTTRAGQENYNFGRDVTRNLLGKIPGFKTLGDTSKGWGAIVSGGLNVGYEAFGSGDAAALKLTGLTAKRALNAPVVEPMGTTARKFFGQDEVVNVQERYNKTINMIKDTVAGKETPLRVRYDFYKNHSASELLQRKEFDSDHGQIAAHLLAGAPDEVIGLLHRVGLEDAEAIATLADAHAAKFAEWTRIEDAITTVNKGGELYFEYAGKNLHLSKKYANNVEFLEAEMKSLRAESNWLEDALTLRGTMKKDNTAARWSWVEKLRNDFAVEGAARKLATGEISQMETKVGEAYQWAYQKSPFSKFIRGVDRLTDDAPKPLINYNEPIMANTRLASNMRQAEKLGASIGSENARLFDKWTTARTEAEKDAVLDEFVNQSISMLSNKYGVPANIVEELQNRHLQFHTSLKNDAKNAKIKDTGFMNDPMNPENLLSDPQLITQLSNGYMLPDFKFIDAALKDFTKRKSYKLSFMQKSGEGVKWLADEVNAIWRTGTLLRGGYPINVIKDTHIRAWGDAVLFDMWKLMGEDAMQAVLNDNNTVARVSQWVKGKVNPEYNITKLRERVDMTQANLDLFAKSLKKRGYDVKNPTGQKMVNGVLKPKKPKEITDPDLLRHIANYKELENNLTVMRGQINSLVNAKPQKRISKDNVVAGDEIFNNAFGGRFGSIFESKITGRDDIRRAMASIKELEIDAMARSRKGARAVLPTEEKLHLQTWEQILNDKLRFDEVARKIMSGKSKNNIIEWLKSAEGSNIMQRFGLDRKDAATVYERAKAMVDMYAPTKQLQDLIMSDSLTARKLVELYPDLNTRPPVFSDLYDDVMAQSTFVRSAIDKGKDIVAWMSTQPTAKLGFNPYFRVKYEEDLQGSMLLANAQGRILTPKDKDRFEQQAREYALKEYREKLNSFHRDMNYSGFMNYILAFFPAVVEQFRAYGRIMLDHPEFAVKKLQIATSPEQFSQVHTDQFGNEYFEVDMPWYGLKSRIPTSWFNVDNPTGGTLLSTHPIAASMINEYAKRTQTENWFTDLVLPFGVQQNSLNALTANTVKRAFQVYQATRSKSGEQFNKDVNMVMNDLRHQYIKEHGVEPSDRELPGIVREAQKRAEYISVARFVSAMSLPVQGRIVTPIQYYADKLAEYNKKYGSEGTEQFNQDFPEYYMLADSLTSSTSGLNNDKNAANLVKKNMDGAVLDIVAAIGEKNVGVLGAVFNDDNYAFSQAAQLYLQNTKIPGTTKKFRDVSDAFENARSGIVSRGWNNYFKLEDIVKNYMTSANPPISPETRYGQQILKQFKEDYVTQMQQQNKLWYDEYQGMGRSGRREATIKALTVAVENDNLWKDLQKQPKWHIVTDYLNYRFYVNSMLKQMGTTIDSNKAYWLREQVDTTVAKLKAQDAGFSKLYERYLSNDDFQFVYEGE